MGQLRVQWAPAGASVLSGDYTLSSGITPSVMTLVCAPFAGQIPAVSDITFDDGAGRLTFKDCLFNARASDRSAATWRLQFFDRRWRWRFGVIVDEWNQNIQDGIAPVANSPQAVKSQNAREIARQLLEDPAMGETNFDIDALPTDQYPAVKWDCANPAKELASLCDKYQLLICYDPCVGKVTLCKRGAGLALPLNATVMADEITATRPPKPEKLLALTGPTEHEHDFLLEPVAMDTDGSIKPINDAGLSYRPAAGWGADVLLFSGVPDTEITDPNNPTLKTTAQKMAEQTVYRWYRIVPARVPGWKYLGVEWANPKLSELLPISGELVEAVQVTHTGQTVSQRRPAFVYGAFADDLERMSYTNSAATVYPKKFDLDEEHGIVKFSEPVFMWTAAALPTGAEIYLRCVVFGERYTKTRDMGGSFGTEPVDCSHLTVQYRAGVAQNQGKVDTAVDAILAIKAAEYDVVQSGSRTYIGIQDLKLDGKVQQISWSIGPAGATTQASESSEHDPWVPSESARRGMERGAVRTYTPAAEAVIVPGNDTPASQFAQPRLQGASNAYAGEVPAFSLVAATLIAKGIWTVTRPSADSQVHVLAVGPGKIPQSGAGLVSADWPLPVKYAGAAPSVGDERGTAANSFELTTGKKGFIVWAVDSANGLAWVAPAASSGGGGTATLPGATQILQADNTNIYAGLSVLLTYTAPGAGTYAFAGAAQINNGGAGSISLYLCKNSAQQVGQTDINLAQAISCLAIPLVVLSLAQGDVVTLEAIAYGGSSTDGAMANACWLTNIGPLAMTVS